MSFFKFLMCAVLFVIFMFVGQYIVLFMMGAYIELFGAFGLVVGFVVFCWLIWGFSNLILKC